MRSEGVLRDIKTARFRRNLFVRVFTAGGVIATALQVWDVLDPGAPGELDWVVPGSGLVALLYGVAASWPRPIRQTYSISNTEVQVVVGDLFELDENIVVGMSTTFDTELPHIISERSVVGQLVTRVYRNDRTALDADLSQALAAQQPCETVSKPGKCEAYPMGTVATIQQGRRFYFGLAYTEMNELNEARGTTDGVWRSLDNLWREVRSVSNGDPVAIPVLGGGQARMAQVLTAQDSIRLIALSFVLASRVERICDRLDIVVRPEDVPRLDMLEIGEFLASLKPS